MNREEAHKLVDQLFDLQTPTENDSVEPKEERKLPEGKRAVRTKSSGDRVYVLDEEKKTRQWVTTAEILDAIGFKMEDVVTIEDSEVLKYQLASPIYKAPEKASDVA